MLLNICTIALGLALTSTQAFSAASSMNHDVEFDSLRLYGQGCPDRSATVYMEAADLVEINYRELETEIRGTRNYSTDCEARLTFRVQRGYRFAVESVTMVGEFELNNRGVVGSITIDTTMGRSHRSQLTSRSDSGPKNSRINFTDRSRSMDFSDCDMYRDQYVDLRVDTRLSLRSDSSTGYGYLGGVRSEDNHDLTQNFRLYVQRCDSNPPPSDNWRGTCEVVYETVWGQNIKSYYGRSSGRSQREAVDLARRDGINQCENRRNGDNLYKCTVHKGNCSASRG